MIDRFASSLLNVVILRLEKWLETEFKNFKDAPELLRKLEAAMKRATRSLNNVDYFNYDDTLQEHVGEMLRMWYEAEDIINYLEHESKKHRSTLQVLERPKNWWKPHEIKNVLEKLDRETEIMGENEGLSLSQGPNIALNNSSDCFSLHRPHFGRDNDISAIVEELTCLEKRTCGVSIVGMKGLGKKALAHVILRNEKVQKTFPLIFRVSMSENTFTCNDMSKLEVMHPEKLRQNGSYYLKDLHNRRRWLLFIDNLLQVSTIDWSNFQPCLSEERKMLITTVNHHVAKVTDTRIRHLRRLSDENCKELITHEKNLLHGRDINDSVINIWAKESCGLPRVAISLIRNYDEQSPIDKNLWSMKDFKKIMYSILGSTKHLKPRLKQCFAYFSLFPRDYHFIEEDLIHLWIGEGLVQPNEKSFTENGRDCFKSLMEQSLLQPVLVDNRETGRYDMHQFIHDFAQRVGSKTHVRLCEGGSDLSCCNRNTLHLSFSQKIEPEVWKQIKGLKALRTLLSLYDSQIGEIGTIPSSVFETLKRLRVLVLKKTDITKLPDSINRLKCLRYLDISQSQVVKLPEKLCELYFLQILKFKGSGLKRLPEKFSHMTSLVFVDWDKIEIGKLMSKPCNIGALINLQTLPLYLVGDKDGHRITELKNMNHLQGSICISNLENVRNEAEAAEAMLHNKSSLQRLELEWKIRKNDSRASDVLEGLKPHDNLRELQIVNYRSSAFPLWLSQSLPMLKKLQLKRCHSTNLPALGQLPALKTLHVEQMSNLISLDGCFSGATTLCQLKITGCPKLESLPTLNDLTSLADLQIESCEGLSALPELPTSLKLLNIIGSHLLSPRCQNGGEDWTKVDCVVEVKIDGVNIPTSAGQRIQSTSSNSQNYILKGFRYITSATSIFGRLLPFLMKVKRNTPN